MKEEGLDEQQIRGAEEDYKAGRFARARELARQGEKALISLLSDEIKDINKNIVFTKRERTLYFDHYNILLDVSLEDGTFALIEHSLDRIVSEKDIRLLLDMAKIVKTYGFRERGT